MPYLHNVNFGSSSDKGEPDYLANSAQREDIINIRRIMVGLLAEDFYRPGEGRLRALKITE
jgi:hypothetical protein